MAAISNKRIRVRDNSAGWLSGRRVGFLFQERIKRIVFLLVESRYPGAPSEATPFLDVLLNRHY
jgi:hypothetical protein